MLHLSWVGKQQHRLAKRLARSRPLLVELEGRCVPSFLHATPYRVGNFPVDVAVADFDNDNIPDLAVTNRDGTVSILLGNGDGTFQSQHTFPAGNLPTAVTAGDFDGDGIIDLAVTNYSGNAGVSILLGNGDGTFQPPVFYPLPGIDRPELIAAADFDNDGILDIAVVNLDGAPLSVLLGNGDGTFRSSVNYGGPDGYSLAVGDLNGDGNQDIVVAGSLGLTVYYGDGTGAFPIRQTFDTGNGATGVAIGDMNGDSIPDLVADCDRQVFVLLGNGDGTFGSPMSYDIGAGRLADGIVLADFNGDGNLDVATANPDSSNVSVLLGNGDGSLQASQTYGVDNYPIYLAAGDLNGDGFPDLVTANYYSNDVSVLLNDGVWTGPHPGPGRQPGGGTLPGHESGEEGLTVALHSTTIAEAQLANGVAHDSPLLGPSVPMVHESPSSGRGEITQSPALDINSLPARAGRSDHVQFTAQAPAVRDRFVAVAQDSLLGLTVADEFRLQLPDSFGALSVT